MAEEFNNDASQGLSIEDVMGKHFPANDTQKPDSDTGEPLNLPRTSDPSDEMKKLQGLLDIISSQPFYFGLSWNESPEYRRSRKKKIANFIKYGFTQFDLTAEFISTALDMLLRKLAFDPITFVGAKLHNFLQGDDGLVMLLPKIIASLVFIPIVVLSASVEIAVNLTSFAINLTLRAVSTVLGLAVTPVNLMFNHVNESKTPYQEMGLGLGATSCVAAAALWMLLSANMMNATVLGTTAIAAWVIASAWPLVIATSAAGVGLLIGVGIYKVCTAGAPSQSTVVDEAWQTDWTDDQLPTATGSLGDSGMAPHSWDDLSDDGETGQYTLR